MTYQIATAFLLTVTFGPYAAPSPHAQRTAKDELFDAIKRESPERAALVLLRHPTLIDELNASRVPILSAAVEAQSRTCVAYLLARGASTEVNGASGESPLAIAMQLKDPRITALIAKKKNPSPQKRLHRRFDRSVFDKAIFEIDVPTIEFCARLSGISTKELDEAAAHLTLRGDFDAVHTLIKAGASIEAKGERNRSLLLLAVIKRRDDILEYLIANHADVNSADEEGWTALHLVMEMTNDAERFPNEADRVQELLQLDAIAKALIKAGAKMNVLDRYGKVPLDRASDRFKLVFRAKD